MKRLQFFVGETEYGLPVEQIERVVPYVPLRSPDSRLPYFIGWLDYRGKPVPVVDVSRMLAGRPAPRLLSTRLVIVGFRVTPGVDRLGLVVERATCIVEPVAGDAATTRACRSFDLHTQLPAGFSEALSQA